MINFLVWIILGGILGWIASMIMRTDAQQGTFLNIIVVYCGCLPGWHVLKSTLWRQHHQPEQFQHSIAAGFVAGCDYLACYREFVPAWHGALTERARDETGMTFLLAAVPS